jgi:hypothetical protein
MMSKVIVLFALFFFMPNTAALAQVSGHNGVVHTAILFQTQKVSRQAGLPRDHGECGKESWAKDTPLSPSSAEHCSPCTAKARTKSRWL